MLSLLAIRNGADYYHNSKLLPHAISILEKEVVPSDRIVKLENVLIRGREQWVLDTSCWYCGKPQSEARKLSDSGYHWEHECPVRKEKVSRNLVAHEDWYRYIDEDKGMD